TETTGLSGGTGTVAFLVGLAWRDGDGLRLVQYFLSDFNQESALLWAVGQCVRDAGVLVSYNGRSFDWPLLQTRLVMRRADPAWPSPPHLDLLTLARRIFKPRLPDCALQTIEQAVLDLHRADDLPGSLLPGRYFALLLPIDGARCHRFAPGSPASSGRALGGGANGSGGMLADAVVSLSGRDRVGEAT